MNKLYWTGKVCTQETHTFSSVSPKLSSVSWIYMCTAYVTYSFKVLKFNSKCCSVYILNYLSVSSPSQWNLNSFLKSSFPKSVKNLCFPRWGYSATADGAEPHVRNTGRFITHPFKGKTGTCTAYVLLLHHGDHTECQYLLYQPVLFWASFFFSSWDLKPLSP